MKRARSHGIGPVRVIVRGTTSAWQVQTVGSANGAAVDDGATDAVRYVIHFRPALVRETASQVHVHVEYVGEKRILCRALFGRCVWPKDAPHERVVLQPDSEWNYVCFETHAIRIEPSGDDGDEVVCALYFTLLNVTTTALSPLEDMILAPEVDLLMSGPLHDYAGIQGVPWWPPDVDPAYWGLRYDTARIPQRSPLWFKLRGFSGTKAYKALGFFLDKDAPSLDAPSAEPITDEARIRMRRGTYSEADAVLMYSCRWPDRRLRESGFVKCASPPEPSDWGASPDMCVVGDAVDGIDTIIGALEIKTTERGEASDYHIPQCYMVMIAMQCQWIDLVVFTPRRYRVLNNPLGEVEDVARVHRIHRDPEVEKQLRAQWMRVIHAPPGKAGAVAHDEASAGLRKQMAEMARALPYEELRATEVPHYIDRLRALYEHKEQLSRALPAPGDSMDLRREEHRERTLEVARALKRHASRAEVARLIGAQVSAFIGDE